MFPTVGDLHIAPFTDELLYMEQFTKANFWYQQSFHGVDLSPLRDDAVSDDVINEVVLKLRDVNVCLGGRIFQAADCGHV